MSNTVKPTIGSYRRHLLVCTGPRCAADGQAQALYDSLGARFKAAARRSVHCGTPLRR